MFSPPFNWTFEKRKYSSGYHIHWHHQKKKTDSKQSKNSTPTFSKKSTIQNIGELYTYEKINYDQFGDKYPLPKASFPTTSNRNPVQLSVITFNPDLAYIPTQIDTQVTLTPQEVEDNYFINSSGQKKKYRRGLRNLLIFGGIGVALLGAGILPLAILGLSAFIVGIALPKPNKNSLVASHSQLLKSKNDNKAAATVGISMVVITLILIVGTFILLGLLFAA